jgi:hypothetical protein
LLVQSGQALPRPNVEDWPYSSFHRDHRDNPRPGDLASFEKCLAAYARSGYGEREDP